jgi:hypothetical protein
MAAWGVSSATRRIPQRTFLDTPRRVPVTSIERKTRNPCIWRPVCPRRQQAAVSPATLPILPLNAPLGRFRAPPRHPPAIPDRRSHVTPPKLTQSLNSLRDLPIPSASTRALLVSRTADVSPQWQPENPPRNERTRWLRSSKFQYPFAPNPARTSKHNPA